MSSHDLYIACFFDAIRTRNPEAVRTLLVLYDIDINDNSSYEEYYGTAMHIAAETNDEPMIRLVASLGGAVDGVDYYGITPLYEAMRHDRRASARVLLELGANLYAPVLYFNRETGSHFTETPLSANKKHNAGRPADFAIPYTIEHARLEKLRRYARVVGRLMLHYRRSVERVWRPGGTGYRSAESDFYKHLAIIEVA